MLLTYSTSSCMEIMPQFKNEIRLVVDHIDFLTYQVGEMTEEAYWLLFWLRVILPVVFMVNYRL